MKTENRKYKEVFKVFENNLIDKTKDADLGYEHKVIATTVVEKITRGSFISIKDNLTLGTEVVIDLTSKISEDYYVINGTHRANLKGNGGYFYEWNNKNDRIDNTTKVVKIFKDETTGKFIQPQRTGWTVDGVELEDTWTYDLTRAIIDVDANWIENKYTIRYDANGGEGIMSGKVDIKYTEEYMLPANTFTKKGFAFDGWIYGGKSFSDKANVKELTTIDKDTVTMVAKWKKAKYTINFDAKGGCGTMTSQTIEYGDDYKLPANTFTRAGWTFNGWLDDVRGKRYGNEAYIEKVLYSDIKDADIITLKAEWIETNDIQGTLRLFGEGGYISGVGTLETKYKEDEHIGKVQIEKPGYTFKYWLHDSLRYNYPMIWNYGKDTVELHAVWEEISYKIRYNVNNGNSDVVLTDDLKYNNEYIILSNIEVNSSWTKENYDFKGWSFSANGNKIYDTGARVKNPTVEKDKIIDLYAVCEAKEYSIKLNNWNPRVSGYKSITINTSYGKGTQLETIATESYIENVDDEFRYVFAGWSITVGGNIKYLNRNYTDIIYVEERKENIELFEVWKKESLKPYIENKISYLIFNGNGGSVNSLKRFTVPLKLNDAIPYPYVDSLFKKGQNVLVKTSNNKQWEWFNKETDANFDGATVGFDGINEIYVKWHSETNRTHYTVNYNAKDKTNGTINPQAKQYTDIFDVPTSGYERTNYNLVGWDINPDATTVVYPFGSTAT